VIVARNFFPQSFFVQLSVEVSAALSRIENASSHLSRSPFRYENLQNSVRAQDDVYLFDGLMIITLFSFHICFLTAHCLICSSGHTTPEDRTADGTCQNSSTYCCLRSQQPNGHPHLSTSYISYPSIPSYPFHTYSVPKSHKQQPGQSTRCNHSKFNS
jgi:hypothetical protein